MNADGELISNEISFNETYGITVLSDESMISKPKIWENKINYNKKSGVKCKGVNNCTVLKNNLISYNK